MRHVNYNYVQVTKWNKNPPPLNEEVLLAAIGGGLYLIGIGKLKENRLYIGIEHIEWTYKEFECDPNYGSNLIINRWRYLPEPQKIQITLEL